MGKIQEIIDSRQAPGILGTRDSFGIKNAFVDEKTGQEIDTWKKWEKAGYKQAKDMKDSPIKEKILEKEKKCRQRGDRTLDSRNLPM